MYILLSFNVVKMIQFTGIIYFNQLETEESELFYYIVKKLLNISLVCSLVAEK